MTMRKTFLPFHIPYIDQDEIDEVVNSLRSGWLTTGPKVKQSKEGFDRDVGAHHAIAVNSGMDVLYLILIGYEKA